MQKAEAFIVVIITLQIMEPSYFPPSHRIAPAFASAFAAVKRGHQRLLRPFVDFHLPF